MVRFIQTSEEFANCVGQDMPTIVDFTAAWCGPCKSIAPLFEQLSVQYKDSITCVKVDVDHLEDVVTELGIEAMPTFLAFKKGLKLDDAVQGADEPKLRELFQAVSAL